MKLYLMEKFVMNRDFPYPTETLSRTIDPFHNSWFVTVLENSKKEVKELRTIDKLIEYIYTIPVHSSLVCERHPDFPEEVDIEGYVEKYDRLHHSNAEKLVKKGINIEEFYFT